MPIFNGYRKCSVFVGARLPRPYTYDAMSRFAFLFRVIISSLLFTATYAPAALRLVSPIPPTSVCALQQ